MISDDKILSLDPNPGAVFMLARTYGNAEFIVAYSRSVLVEKWGCYCIDAFHRVSNLDFSRCWAEPAESDLMIYYSVTVYLVAEEGWMLRTS